MRKIYSKTVRIGEGILGRDLAEVRLEILRKIKSDIDSIRNSNYYKYDRPNNFISILGGRGSGKSSMILTILNDLRDKNNSYVEGNDKIKCDFILDKIDPSLFNVEKNALGWIIYSFEEIIKAFKELNNKNQYCSKNNSIKCAIDEYEKLEEYYITSREFYRENLSKLSEGTLEYKKVNTSIGKADLKLEKQFRRFINEYINAIKVLREKSSNEEEPLIVISFDDIDIKPQYGPDILDTVTNYLCHPNIVVIISGDKNTFKEALLIELWNKSKVPQQFSTDELIFGRKIKEKISIRVEDILAKVMPPRYRYQLKEFSVKDRLLFTPYGENQDTIADLLKKCRIDDEDILSKYFINPSINVDDIIKEMESKFKGIGDGAVVVRSYQGIEEEYGILNEYSKISNKIKKWINTSEAKAENDEKNKSFKDIINENTNIDNIITSLCELLPGTPRGLINLYYKIEELNKENTRRNKEIEIEIEKEKEIAKGKNKTLGDGYKLKRLRHISKFKFISALYEILNECKLKHKIEERIDEYDLKDVREKRIDEYDLKDIREDFVINKIIKFNKETYKVNFNFKDITIENGEDYKHNIFNTSKEIIMKYNCRKIDKAESALIQFFYDICKENLLEQYIQIDRDKNFTNIVLYRRQEEKNIIEVCSENLKTFRDYYKMNLLYELSIPLIAENLKVHRNIRDRLRVNMAQIIEYIMNDGAYKYILKKYKLRNIKNSDYKLELHDKYENYYGGYFWDNENSEDRDSDTYSLINFITSYVDKNNYYEKYYNYYDNEIIDLLYSKLVSNIFSSMSKINRMKVISSIIKDENYNYKDGKSILSSLCIQVEKFDKWYENKNKKYDVDVYWNSMALELFTIECILTVKIIKNLIKDTKEEHDDLNKFKEDVYKDARDLLKRLDDDYKKIILKKSNVWKQKFIKINNEVFNDLEEIKILTEEKKIPDNVDRIEKYIEKYEKDFIENNKSIIEANTKWNKEIREVSDEKIEEDDNEEIYFDIIKESPHNENITGVYMKWIKSKIELIKNLLNTDEEKEKLDEYIKSSDKSNLKTVIIKTINKFIKILLEEKNMDLLERIFREIGNKKFFIGDNNFLTNLEKQQLQDVKKIYDNKEIEKKVESLLTKIDEENQMNFFTELNEVLENRNNEEDEKDNE